MKQNCLDIGIIQAFLDGEVSHETSQHVSRHIAVCESCARATARAENESALVFGVLEREFDALVPTQRLWNKINDSLVTDRENRSIWHKVYAYIAIAASNPSLTVAAGFLVVIGIFSVVFLNRADSPSAEIPATQVVAERVQVKPYVAEGSDDTTIPVSITSTTRPASYRAERAVFRAEPRRAAPTAVGRSSGYLPGEESYVKTISTLAKSVDEQKGSGMMRASELNVYERDMAVVNDAIFKMKREVKRNPRNESAKQVLYTSYQNKIDLLNSVAAKEELLVSLR
jgi:hypothetical protein